MDKKDRRFSLADFWKAIFVVGLFTGLLTFLAYFSINVFTNSSFSILYIIIYLFPFFAMLFEALNFRNNYAYNEMYFIDTFSLTSLTGLVSSVVMSLLIYLIYKYLNAGDIESRLRELEASIVTQSSITQIEDIKQLRDTLRTILSPTLLALWMFVLNIALTIIYALVISIFVRKKKTFIP